LNGTAQSVPDEKMNIMNLAGKWLVRAARHKLGQATILWSFDHMSTILLIHRLREIKNLIALHHPEPAYPLHILIIPKQPIAKFMDLSPSAADLMSEMIQMVQSLPQLHFHLISGSPAG